MQFDNTFMVTMLDIIRWIFFAFGVPFILISLNNSKEMNAVCTVVFLAIIMYALQLNFDWLILRVLGAALIFLTIFAIVQQMLTSIRPFTEKTRNADPNNEVSEVNYISSNNFDRTRILIGLVTSVISFIAAIIGLVSIILR